MLKLFNTVAIVYFMTICIDVSTYVSLNRSPVSSCYSNGRVHQCMPAFTNIVENILPNITTNCGVDSVAKTCSLDSFSIKYITDFHNIKNSTCWTSNILSSSSVNITFHLKKKFEIYYISLTPCSVGLPDAIIFYKSQNFGLNWTEWQYFAKDCVTMFNMEEESVQPSNNRPFQSSQNIKYAKCFPLILSKSGFESVVAFSTAIGGPYDRIGDTAMIDWMTASDIRISLFKFNLDDKNESSMQKYLSLADISVGGRCKCNGHSNICNNNKNTDRLECDCQHNTEGQDCERCKPNYLDQPWARATMKSPAVCKKCNCNLHSSTCIFNKELYIIRGKVTGGVCTNCQHNTAGTRCHYCVDGFYRDWTKPLDHKFVCKKCACHPIGAKFRDKCHKRTSQCFCKEGVTGEICNRCLPGYRQTRSSVAPCARNIQMEPAEKNCSSCHSRRSRIRFKKFCRKDAVFMATLQSQETIGNLIRFDVYMDDMWHCKSEIQKFFPSVFKNFSNSQKSLTKDLLTLKSTNAIWLKAEDTKCLCVNLQLGQTYLFIIKSEIFQHQNRAELLVKASGSVILKWRSSWIRRLEKFKRRKQVGHCEKFKKRSRFRKTLYFLEGFEGNTN